MSRFGVEIIDRLHSDSALRNLNNPVRMILDFGLGEWLDQFDDEYLGEEVYLESATGSFLDLWGKEYGVLRRTEESDDDYRTRIFYNAGGGLTVPYLETLYGVLFWRGLDFNVDENVLVSDNLFLDGHLYASATRDMFSVLMRKFIVDQEILWVDENGVFDVLLDDEGVNHIWDYMYLYSANIINRLRYRFDFDCVDLKLFLPNAKNVTTLCEGLEDLNSAVLDLPNATNCIGLFYNCPSLDSVVLNLPNATDCRGMFRACTSLDCIDLTLPNAQNCDGMFRACTSLTSIKLNLPRLKTFPTIVSDCTGLETIEVTIPLGQVEPFLTEIGLTNLPNLSSLKINGEEYIDQ